MDIRIALCDDEKQQRDYLTLLLRKWNPKAHIEAFESAESFKMMREEKTPHDILLLDIQMGGQDGVSLAKELRAANEELIIIFITGVPDFIQEGYDVAALHYLMKPVNESKLFTVLDRAVSQVSITPKPLLLPVEGETVKLSFGDILYIESFAHYLEVVTVSGTITVKMPTYKLEQLLSDEFIRCHRSYLVNMRHISKITKTDITLDNGKFVPLSRRMQSSVSETFIAYIAGASPQ
ncbi:MAG: LytTR family DNA-binding domain-containing protein [Defluviitaleaceae bacterium]|nr:LytTR family DNA-binding domain-containing protein [Defluviitaleaceae bacterium]